GTDRPVVPSYVGDASRGRGQKPRLRLFPCGCACGGLSSTAMSEMTHILSAIEQGDAHAASELLPLVYEELRRLAEQRMAQEAPGQTLQATGLVHEAYLRLVGVAKAQQWDSRGHFFAAAAEAMRRILIDRARAKGTRKRGGQGKRVDLDHLTLTVAAPSPQMLALDEALTELERHDAPAAHL